MDSNLHHGFLRNLWIEYTQGCSIYAMRHLSAKLNIVERIWWFLWIGLAVVGCFVSMVDLYEKWNQSPVLISYDRRFLPVWAVPFPAVTVCPMARAQSELFNSTDIFFRIDEEGITNIEYLRLRALLHVCPYMSEYYEYNDSLPVNYVNILQNIAIPFEDMFVSCKFRNYALDCSTYLSRSITDSGVCYTFNAIDADDLLRTENLQSDFLYSNSFVDSSNWTLEDGYLDEFELETYPLRPVGGGLVTGLVLVLKTRKQDKDYVCEGPVIGYKIGIHSPDEKPSVQNRFYRLSHQTILTLTVKPELTYISQKLKQHPYTRRQCYFAGERYLRYFRVYNRKNCLEECISNITAHECGCVGFASPRAPDIPVCDGEDLTCPTISFYRLLKRMGLSERDDELEEPCGCLPACTTLRFDVEISDLPWDFEAYARAAGLSTDQYDYIEPAVLVVALKSKWLLPLKRRELFGVVDLLAKFGGLFGLVMGASVISMLEVVYYCIIRPWRNDYPESNARPVLPWLEYWWIIWMGISLGACIFSIVTMYRKWDDNPVAILYGAELEPVSTVPFPAVTICPLTKSRIEVFNLTQAFETLNRNLSLDELSERKLRTLAHVCPFIRNWREFENSLEEDVVFDLRTMAHSLKSLMVRCWWRSSVVSCGSLMMERLVDDGICYTFNSLALHEIYKTDQISPDFLNFSNIAPQSDWTRDYGYRPGAGLDAYPNLPLTNGLISGVLIVPVVRQIDYEPLCMGTYTGFKIAVHSPDEVAWTDDRFFRLDTLTTLMLDLTPKVTKATEKLRSLSPSRRNCYFSDERSLRFFKLYNQINCVAECVSNYTLSKCGCVKFSMPRSIDSKICDASKIECYRNSSALYEIMVRANLAGRKYHSCNCMPSCASVDYGVAISQDVFHFHDFPIELEFIANGVDPSLVMVSFKDRYYASMLRRELVGINQAIAELGGLFALLLGGSMLSLAEIVYFCCIRWLRRERPQRINNTRDNLPPSRGHRIRMRVDPWAKHQRILP